MTSEGDENESDWESDQESKADPDPSDDEDYASTQSWAKKVRMPTFEGDDPLGWITRAEKFFDIQHIKEKLKLRLAFINMEGNTIYWFQSWKRNTKRRTWKAFTTALVCRYGGNRGGDVYERLAAICQTGTIAEFVQEFEILAAQISGASEAQLRGYFLAGLRDDMRDKIRPH